jgi:transcriptional regulator with XRE-family HTH domain
MTLLRMNRLLSETSLHSLGRSVGLSATELSRVERKLINPSPRMVSALQDHFGVSIAHLLSTADLPARHNPS